MVKISYDTAMPPFKTDIQKDMERRAEKRAKKINAVDSAAHRETLIGERIIRDDYKEPVSHLTGILVLNDALFHKEKRLDKVCSTFQCLRTMKATSKITEKMRDCEKEMQHLDKDLKGLRNTIEFLVGLAS